MATLSQDVRDRILEGAYERFRQFGVRRVTMDEISGGLRMSKKTLYRHFTGKKELVRELLMREYSWHLTAVLECINHGGTAQEAFLAGFARLGEMLRQASPVFLADVRSEYPDIWEEFEALRGRVLDGLAGAVARGVEHGEIRAEVHPRIAAGIMECVVRNYMVPDTFRNAEFSPRQAWLTWITMVTSGLFREPIDVAGQWD